MFCMTAMAEEKHRTSPGGAVCVFFFFSNDTLVIEAKFVESVLCFVK